MKVIHFDTGNLLKNAGRRRKASYGLQHLHYPCEKEKNGKAQYLFRADHNDIFFCCRQSEVIIRVNIKFHLIAFI
jgi:hypothetical protein